MDTNIKTCLLCEDKFDGLIGIDTEPICDDCKELLCSRISKKYKDELCKAFNGLKITSRDDRTYLFGSALFFMNKSIFIPVIISKTIDGYSFQFHNTEEDREAIIDRALLV